MNRCSCWDILTRVKAASEGGLCLGMAGGWAIYVIVLCASVSLPTKQGKLRKLFARYTRGTMRGLLAKFFVDALGPCDFLPSWNQPSPGHCCLLGANNDSGARET